MHGVFPKTVRLRSFLREYLWWPVAQVTAGFHLLPPLAAIVLFLLLIRFGQLREIYLSYVESPSLVHILCAVVAFAMLSAALSIFHYALSPMQAEVLFHGSAEPYTGSTLSRLQQASALLLSAVPWIGLVVGLYSATKGIAEITGHLKEMGDPFRSSDMNQALSGMDQLAARMDRLAERMWPAMVLVGLMGAPVCLALHRCNRSLHRRRWWQVILLTIGMVLTAVGLAPVIGEGAVSFYRALGPLAALALTFLFFFCILGAVAYCSKQVSLNGPAFPAVTLAVLAVAVGASFDVSNAALAIGVLIASALFVALALFLRLDPALTALGIIIGVIAFCTAGRERFLTEQMTVSDQPFSQKRLTDAFKDWLDKRPDRASWPPASRYPVFIIAVEGGGIYAAAAASAFLARLQDRCPNFAQHVFAISGVSGGAIGATSFRVLANALPQATQAAPCRTPSDNQYGLMPSMAAVMQADHFSPVVASILPDFIGLKWDRVEGLQTSFLKSLEETGGADTVKSLRKDFKEHWSEQSIAPALVLNATWAETGNRVGFAPFELKNDPSFLSFYDKDMLGGAKHNDNKEKLTLMKAAAVSARFPGILPPYAILRREEKKDQKPSEVRWNFVDGGYADPSGAATALQIFRALNELEPQSQDVQLTLVVLTNAARRQNFQDINGTAFRDIIGPIDAVLKSRKALAGQAIARLDGYFSTRDPDRLKFIQLQDEVFNLPLGWKLSSVTYQIVSLLVGREDLCIDKNRLERRGDVSVTFSANGCVIRDIERALAPPRQ